MLPPPELLKAMSETRQTLLFSATMPKMLVDFVKAGLKDPLVVRLDAETKVSELLQIVHVNVKPDEKIGALIYLLREVVAKQQQTIVFAATRHHVEYITQLLHVCEKSFESFDFFFFLLLSFSNPFTGSKHRGIAHLRSNGPHCSQDLTWQIQVLIFERPFTQ